MIEYTKKEETFQGEVWTNSEGQYKRLVEAGILMKDSLHLDGSVYTAGNYYVKLHSHIIVGSQGSVHVLANDAATKFFDYGA